MAFSAKASEARPCPHDSSGFMRVGRLLAQRSRSVLCFSLSSWGATNRPLARQPALFMTVRREIA